MVKLNISENKYNNLLGSDKIFKTISSIADQIDQKAFVIGGYVRDQILNRTTKDIDIVTIGSGIELAKKTANFLNISPVKVFKNFGTAMINVGDLEVQFVGARKESYRKDSRNPIVENGTVEEDQNRRDFTINALAISLNKENYGAFIDLGGMDGLVHITDISWTKVNSPSEILKLGEGIEVAENDFAAEVAATAKIK